MNRWESFASLRWYDDVIEFTFRLVAKTSEPLLALGLVISAADFLSKGALLSGNMLLSEAWVWCQAIAIEASSGVVFVYALQSFRQKDKVKAWIYLILSILLAITGGAMLMFQLIANTTGLQETSLPPVLFYSLAGLRVLVSISYVYLCRAKHIRFTDLADETASVPHNTSTSISDETLQLILAKLAEANGHNQAVIDDGETPLALPETAGVPPLETVVQGFIYKLVDPRNEKPFYVGQTTGHLSSRLSDHTTKPVNAAKREIIDELTQEGLKPRIEALETVYLDTDLDEREQYWIDNLIEQGCELTNAYPPPSNYYDGTEGYKKRRIETAMKQAELQTQLDALTNVLPDLSTRTIASIVGRSHTTVVRALARANKVKQSPKE